MFGCVAVVAVILLESAIFFLGTLRLSCMYAMLACLYNNLCHTVVEFACAYCECEEMWKGWVSGPSAVKNAGTISRTLPVRTKDLDLIF